VKIIQPRIFRDARGYFVETYNAERYKAAGILADFVQDNESCSMRGVIRGLHWQKPPYTQAKLVRVIRGAVLDVAVDIRKDSPTFGKHVAVTLSAENGLQLYVPRGFAHGFAVLSESAVFQYKCDNFYHPEADGGISILDESLGIDWGLKMEEALLSEKDTKHPKLAEFDSPFVYKENC
jgi:dTDP-4-dehydrorhamnose 3,5-epimerase